MTDPPRARLTAACVTASTRGVTWRLRANRRDVAFASRDRLWKERVAHRFNVAQISARPRDAAAAEPTPAPAGAPRAAPLRHRSSLFSLSHDWDDAWRTGARPTRLSCD